MDYISYNVVVRLREALAYCARYGTPDVAKRARVALNYYAQEISPLCDHRQTACLKGGRVRACLDCGQRFINGR